MQNSQSQNQSQSRKKKQLRKYSEEVAFIKSLDGTNTIVEIRDMVNERFGTDLNYQNVKQYLYKHGIAYRRNYRHNMLMTDEEAEILMKIIPGRSGKDIVRIFQEETGIRLTLKQLRTWKKNHKCPSGYDTRWRPGHSPYYRTPKGTRNRGAFKIGHKSANALPIGSERVTDGYVYVKYRDGHLNKNWKLKAKDVWERENGPLPEGKVIIYLDKNPLNCSLENLALIDKGTLSLINNQFKFTKDPDTNRAIIYAARLKRSIVKAQKRGKEKAKQNDHDK